MHMLKRAQGPLAARDDAKIDERERYPLQTLAQHMLNICSTYNEGACWHEVLYALAYVRYILCRHRDYTYRHA